MDNLKNYPRPQPPRAPIWPLFAVAAGLALAFTVLITVDPMARVTACAVALEDVK